MPDIDFPVNPSLNATYSKDGKTWIWDGSRWRTNNILSYSGGGTGYASYNTGDLLVGTGNSLIKFPVGQNNFQYLRVDSANSASGVTWISLPLAGSGQSGLVSTLTQTFSGAKTFSSSIIGNLTGSATTSENVNVTTTTRSLTHYLIFTNQTSGSGLALTTSAIGIGFTVNPAQNTLAAGTFVGNLSGTAATTSFLKVTSTSGTALNIADRVTVYTVDNFEGLNINSNYSYALSVQDKANNNKFIVDVGNARTIFTGNSAAHEIRVYNNNESAYFGLKANSTGTQTYILPPGAPSTGSSILQSDNLGNMIWVPMATGGLTNAITSINSQTGPSITLQKGSSGTDFDIATTSNTVTFNLPDASASNRGLVTTGSQTFAGTKTFSSSISGNLSGTATTSQNVNTAAYTNNNVHYLTFTLQNNGAGAALSTSNTAGKLTYRPADEQLSVTFLTGTAFTATNLTGTLFGNVTGTSTTSQNVNTNVYTNNSVHYLIFTLQGSGSGAALSTSNSAGRLTYRPADEQLSVTNLTGTAFTATNFYGSLTGNVTGTATSSQNVNTNVFTNNSVHYLTFTLQGNGSGAALSTSNFAGKLTYRPTDEQLSVTFITGTAFTATNLYGTLFGNVTGTSTTSQNVNVTTTTRSATHYLTFTNATNGSGLALTTSSIGIGFTVNPAQNTLAAGTFVGDLSGTAVTTSFLKVISTSGTALNIADRVTVYTVDNFEGLNISSNYNFALSVQDKSNNNKFIVDVGNARTIFTGSSADHEIRVYNQNQSSYFGLKANATGSVTYILPPGKPSTGSSILQSDDSGNMIWVPMTTGGLANAVTSINSQTGPAITLQTGSSGTDFAISQSANTITFNLPDASASNRGLVTTGSQTIAGSKTFSSSILGNLSGTSTTSENVNVNTTTRSIDHYLIFTNSSSGSGVALTTSTVGSGLTYNPATNTLNALFFTGTATSSRNVHTAQYTNNNVHYLTFTLQGSGAGAALSTSGTAGKLTYRPADEQLSVTYITGTAFTATNLYGTLIGNVTGTATTSENVNVNTTTRSIDHYLLFTNRSSGSGVALTTSIVGMGLTYNPATNTLAAQFFTGTATTSSNVVVNTTTINQNHFLLFSNRSSGSGIALTASTIGIGFTVNPAENTLSAGLFAGNISGTGATFARATFTDNTEATDQLTGSVTFAGGIAVNKKVFSQAIETNGNAIINGNFQAFGSIIQLGNAGLADTIGFICRIQSMMIPQANNSFDIGLNDGSYGWRNAAFAGHGTFANLYGSTSANLTGVEFSGGDVLVKSGKSVKFYEANNTYNTSFKANSSLAGNTDYTLPVGKPGTGASILQSDTAGSMIWVKAASNKATYVLSFGAGFTPTTGLDSVSIAIPYANDGSTQLTYTIKRVEVRTETEPGASTLAFYFERHTTGNATWTVSPITIKGAASANFSVAQNNYSNSFTTITSSSGNNGEVQSGNYLRVNFATVGAAANVSISIMIQEN